jgi:hypothetical protein
MSSTNHHDRPQLLHYINEHFVKLLKWKSIDFKMQHQLIRVNGFKEYNYLVDINSVFSSQPEGMPRDRTLTVHPPFDFKVWRPWQIPQTQINLNQAMQNRVAELLAIGRDINLFWSGGIDSTALVTAFLKHTSTHVQLRVLYSPYSEYEHPEYIKFLKTFNNVELVDISGDVYINQQFDGIFVTGDGGDELMASVDQSFLESHGSNILDSNWQDFFRTKNPQQEFIDFCEHYFSLSGTDINTVLQARWWFYTSCKTRCMWIKKMNFFLGYQNFDPNTVVPFYDCDDFENYVYWNMDQIIPNNNYQQWKLPLKQYSFEFDGFESWYQTKQKGHSNQVTLYGHKRMLLEDQRYICLLDDGTRVFTPSLPLLSNKEFHNKYHNSLDYLFNDPV